MLGLGQQQAADAPLHDGGAQRAMVMAAKVRVKPMAQSQQRPQHVRAMVGAPVSVMLAGWCRVFHQSR